MNMDRFKTILCLPYTVYLDHISIELWGHWYHKNTNTLQLTMNYSFVRIGNQSRVDKWFYVWQFYLSLFSTPLRESHLGEFNSNDILLTIEYRYEIHLSCKYQKLTIVLRSTLSLLFYRSKIRQFQVSMWTKYGIELYKSQNKYTIDEHWTQFRHENKRHQLTFFFFPIRHISPLFIYHL